MEGGKRKHQVQKFLRDSTTRDMDNSVMEGGQLLPGPNGGSLDLESPVHGHQRVQLGHPALSHRHWMGSAGALENDHQTIGLMELKGSARKLSSMNLNKGKVASLPKATDMADLSEDDEPTMTEDGNDEIPREATGKKGSPWQRKKWTANVIRLLIAVVAHVGDDGTFDGIEGLKRKSRILQKKAKWKTVSKIMMGKGCHVSFQQCEDKFNDLNKRYKKLNDLLGRGTSCRVVENPALMDSMPQLSAKAKDSVIKILSSKHLFYKEMCAYHHGQRIPNCPAIDLQCCSLRLESSLKDSHESEEEEAEQSGDSDDDDDDDDEEAAESDDGEIAGKYDERKKLNEADARLSSQAGRVSSFKVELAEVFQNPEVSLWEKKEWIKKQKLQLLDQMICIQAEAFEIEKQQSKWVRYCRKKDKEFERLRLEHERMRLENEQSVLQLRQKHLEMDFKSLEGSLDPTALGIDPNQGWEPIHLGRHQ